MKSNIVSITILSFLLSFTSLQSYGQFGPPPDQDEEPDDTPPDDNIILTIFFRDADGDGFGDVNDRRAALSQPQGYVKNNTDCNDQDANSFPGAAELCDGKDNDCDGSIDEDKPGKPDEVSVSNQCGETILTRGIAPTGITWYWQSTASGTSTLNSTISNSITLTSGSTYYLRARNNTTGCWSAVRTINYTVNQPPTTPTAPTVAISCGSTKLTRATPPSGITWYWQSTSGGKSTSNANSSVTLTSGSTYYLRARNNTTGCWSAVRTINYTINQPPVTPTAPTVAISCGSTKLTKGTPPSGITWYWQSTSGGTSTSNGNSSVTLTSGSTYYLRARNNTTGCWSAVRTIYYSIQPVPTWYKDSDGDGYASLTKTQCNSPGAGYSLTVKPLGDCNDNNASLNPGTIWYADTDGDNFGDPANTLTQCLQPTGYVVVAGDQCPQEAGSFEGCIAVPYQNSTLSNENYVFTRAYQVPLADSTGIRYNKDVIESITYFDGLGRPKQQIAIKGAPDAEDIVTHIGYDGYGRQDKQYLPYVSGTTPGSYKTVDVLNDIQQYYLDKYPADFTGVTNTNEVNAYSESIFEPSPLNRVLEQGAPGAAWKADAAVDTDHTIKFDWSTNDSTEVVYFRVDYTNGNTEAPQLVQQGHYAAGELFVSITKDENWQPADGDLRTTREYKDKQGRVILKRTFNNSGGGTEAHDTYYIYDSFSNLSYVLPPKVNTDDGISQVELDELCYQYKYDYRNRAFAKKMPGKDWEYTIYNKLDQPVLTQDGNLRENDEWLYTKYDALSRIAYTGKITITGKTPAQLQTEANDYTGNLWVERGNAVMIGGATMYYNNDGYPNVQSSEVLTINYYDDYGFLASEAATLNNPNSVYGQPVDNRTKSLTTGSKIKVLGTSYWETTVTYYDKKARPIYVVNSSEYLDITNVVETKFDFVGKAERSKITHTKTGNTPVVTEDIFEYDHMGRPLKQTQSINGQQEVLTSNTYDELGKLVSKEVGDGLQTVDYAYNIRGWLKGINDISNLGTDLFGFKLSYTNPTQGLGAAPIYSGNISETIWRTASDNIQRAYGYNFDGLDRLLNANNSDNRFDVSNITYNKNGGMLSISRNGWQDSSNYTNLDILSISYGSGNKQQSITDTGNTTFGFRDGYTGVDFEYDANGNRTIDRNRGITGVSYNYLDLPTRINVSTTIEQRSINGNLQYVYDANGNKIRKTLTDGSNVTTTDYSGNHIYENGVLKSISHPEGYAEPEGDGTYTYVYQYKDNVENVRLSYSDNDKDGKIDILRNNVDIDGDGDNAHEIVEENNYYPFGGKQKGYNVLIGSTNPALKFKFSNKELLDELGLNIYDYGARQYDPWGGGTWWNVDPLAESFVDLTPYNYSFNNPVLFFDPDGMAPSCCEPELPRPLNNLFTWLEQKAGPAINKGGKMTSEFIASFHPGVVAVNLYQGATTGKDGFGNDVSKTDVGIELATMIPLTKPLKFVGEGLDVVKAVIKNADEGGDLLQGGRRIADEKIIDAPSKRGNAPIGDDGNPIELHHRDQTPEGPIDEMTRTDHRGKGNYKKNHTNTGNKKSKIDRVKFKAQQKAHWKKEWDKGRFDNIKKPDASRVDKLKE